MAIDRCNAKSCFALSVQRVRTKRGLVVSLCADHLGMLQSAGEVAELLPTLAEEADAAQGRIRIGRPLAAITPETLTRAKKALDDGTPLRVVARETGVHRSTLRRRVAEQAQPSEVPMAKPEQTEVELNVPPAKDVATPLEEAAGMLQRAARMKKSGRKMLVDAAALKKKALTLLAESEEVDKC